jgi:nicotinamide-nucleotide amidase
MMKKTGDDGQTLERIVGELLIKKKLTISLAESCSGGLISHRLTNVPGISSSYLLGVVSYSNQAKSQLLKVSPELIKDKGAVSPQVARKMARGVRAISGANLSLGVTGIAGPTGGTPQKPVGLVYIALNTEKGEICQRHLFSGDRETIKWKTSQAALDLLRRYLLGEIKLE